MVLIYVLKILIKGFDDDLEIDDSKLFVKSDTSSSAQDLVEINPDKPRKSMDKVTGTVNTVVEVKPVDEAKTKEENKYE